MTTHEMDFQPDVYIDFTGEVESDQRSTVERSVQAMATHSIRQSNPTRIAESAEAKLTESLNGAAMRQVEADPAAAKAMEEILALPLPADIESIDAARPERSVTQVEAPFLLWPGYLRIWRPPYHFNWSWHRTEGSPPFNSLIDPPTGQVGLDGRSGSPGAIDGGAGSFVEAHSGFGLFFRPPSDGLLIGVPGAVSGSELLMFWNYVVATQGFLNNATVEGGIECSILEDGQWRTGKTITWFRKRVSRFEQDRTGTGGFIMNNDDLAIRCPVLAGHEYTLNVGVWVFCDHTAGAGRAAAGSQAMVVIPCIATADPTPL
ncbi:hypothetical protein [Streptomyces sp. NRRL B-3648]|uniref:hypothetical protein n=1 Tax=Streptomyces sp. NRRL B-3648 TaxID=1519493 RepID=UPI000A9E24DC|nr:hypothetical protein [Streptomyces sp. NRRL B-3648]